MKLVVLASRFPYPLEKGDKLRLFYQIKHLAQRNEITLIALSDTSVAQEHIALLEEFCAKVYVLRFSKIAILWSFVKAFFQQKPFQIAYFYHSFLQKKIDTILDFTQPDSIYCQLIRISPYLSAIKTPKTLDLMDAFSLGMLRRAAKTPWWQRWIFEREARLLLRYEQDAIAKFDHTTIIAQQDADFIEKYNNNKPIQQKCKNIVIVSNGVDTVFFKPFEKSFTPKYDIVFVGNMGYYPNVEAAKYLIQKIVPPLLSSFPTLKVLIAGARPTPELMAMANETITISGWVEDIREAYGNGKVFVAPLFSGSGQQNKILEAMAMGIPCITTTIVNNAIGAKENEAILLADDPETFVKKINLLFYPLNLTQKEAIAKAGRDFVVKKYSWESANNVLENLL